MVRNPLNTYDPLLDKASQAQRGDQEKLQDKKSNKSLQTELHHLVLEYLKCMKRPQFCLHIPVVSCELKRLGKATAFNYGFPGYFEHCKVSSGDTIWEIYYFSGA